MNSINFYLIAPVAFVYGWILQDKLNTYTAQASIELNFLLQIGWKYNAYILKLYVVDLIMMYLEGAH